MKLTDILHEIGEASSTPYNYKYSGDLYEAYFTTDKGTPYKVNFGIDEYDEMEISFGTVDERDNINYEIDTNEGNPFRVMSTIMKIINQAVTQFNPSIISFGATKSDPRRMNMYRKYVINNIKGYSIAHDKDSFLTLQRDTLKDKLKKTFKITEKGMKLTDILREIEGDEDGMKQMKVNYDLAVQPTDVNAALDALNNTANYGIYAQNMRDPKTIEKIFGPSNPGKKSVAAQSDWNSLPPEARLLKIEEIKERMEFSQGKDVNIGNEVFSKVKNALDKNKEYLKWSEENGDNPEKYLATLNGKQASDIGIFGSRGSAYYPQRTPDNLKKYAGKLEQDIHYVVKDGKIIFPSTLENPYKTKPYLSKVLKTIMDNAGVEFQLVDVEQDGGEAPKTVEKPKAETVPPLSVTADSLDKIDKIRKAFQKEIGDVPTAKYETESSKTENGIQYKLVVTGISADQRKKLLVKKSTLKEEMDFDYEMYRMKKLAGL